MEERDDASGCATKNKRNEEMEIHCAYFDFYPAIFA